MSCGRRYLGVGCAVAQQQGSPRNGFVVGEGQVRQGRIAVQVVHAAAKAWLADTVATADREAIRGIG